MSKGETRCVDGRLMRHDPQFDDPYLETDIGKCPDCSGDGCVTQGSLPNDTPYADCRRGSPSTAAYHPGGYTDQLDWVTAWPRTSAAEGCGEHQPQTGEKE